MVTSLGVFGFDRDRHRFRLSSVHPGHTLEEILDNTGFEFDIPPQYPTTPTPSARELELIRSRIRNEVAEVYPRFAARLASSAAKAETKN